MSEYQDFWDFSCACYIKADIAETCLYWQDSFGLNINILLLAIYLERGQYSIAPINQLMSGIHKWQQHFQLSARDVRRCSKALDPVLYNKTKQLELAGERVEQKLLIDCQRRAELSSPTTNNIERVLEYFSIPHDNRRQAFFSRIDRFNVQSNDF